LQILVLFTCVAVGCCHDSSRQRHMWIKPEAVITVKMLLMMSENIARNMWSSQWTINYPKQFHLVGHFCKNYSSHVSPKNTYRKCFRVIKCFLFTIPLQRRVRKITKSIRVPNSQFKSNNLWQKKKSVWYPPRFRFFNLYRRKWVRNPSNLYYEPSSRFRWDHLLHSNRSLHLPSCKH